VMNAGPVNGSGDINFSLLDSRYKFDNSGQLKRLLRFSQLRHYCGG